MFKLRIVKTQFRNLSIFSKKFYSKMDSSYFKIETNNDDIILTPNDGYNSVLIWMHGLGDSALGYKDFFVSNYSPLPKKMKVHLLTAPKAAVTINGGMVMTSWYDIKSFNKSSDSINESDVLNNSSRVKKVVENEAKLLNGDYSKVFLGGFSQGACMTLHVGLTSEFNLAGLVVLSGLIFPFTTKVLEDSKKNIPIFIGHGSWDDVIPEALAKASYQTLFEKKFTNITYKSYQEGHTIAAEEIEDMKNFIEKLL